MASRVTLDLNPKFTFLSPVSSTASGKLQLAEQVDHAIIALDRRAPIGGDCRVELLEPVMDAELLRIELWVSDLDDYTCTYGFVVSSEDGRVPHARGERLVVNVDPSTHRAAKWNSAFRDSHSELLKDLPSLA